MTALVRLIPLIWQVLKMIGVSWFGWELVQTGSAEKIAVAVGNIGEAAGSTAKAVTKTTENLSGGALIALIVIVAVVFLRR